MTVQRKYRRAKKPHNPPPKKKYFKKDFYFKGLDGKQYHLTLKQKQWADRYLEEGANLTIASLEVYKITNKHLHYTNWKFLTDNEKKSRATAEHTAASIGRENLRKPAIYNYINKILNDAGYTEDVVRLEHFKNIKQDSNLTAKNQAIDMYYKKMGKYPRDEGEKDFYEKASEFFDGVRKALPK